MQIVKGKNPSTRGRSVRLKTRARYAVHVMSDIAKHGVDEPVSLGDVADRTRISRRYLDQIAVGLKHAGLITGKSGRRGGYRLQKPASEIHLGEIIEAAIGPINVVECVRHPESCIKSDFCECRSIYAQINGRITEVLNEVSLSELVHRELGRGALEEIGEINTTGDACPAR